MSRDFADGGRGGRQATSGGTPGWLWLVLGVAIGFAAAAFYYIARPAAPMDPSATAAGDPQQSANGKKKITLPPKEPSRFAFYELLPNYEVVIPKEALKEPARFGTTAPPKDGQLYLIQVGSFRDRREAESQKARIALLGIESRIERVTIDDSQPWFRVRIGPERDVARVHTIVAQLEENEIKPLVMRVPQ